MHMTTMELSEMLTPAEAARILDVTPERVRQLSDGGHLAATRTRLGRLFARTDVEALRKQRDGLT
jgi:excisionase family DNA binding protein